MSKKRKRPISPPYIPYAIKNYTPVLTPKPVPGIDNFDDAPLICVTFSAALVPYLLGVLESYRWDDKFIGDPDAKRKAQGIFQDLMDALIGGNCMVDPCCPETNEILNDIKVLNQSIVNNQVTIINNQTTIINHDETIIEQNYTNEYNHYASQYNSFTANNQNISILNQMFYDGDPQSIFLEAGENFNSTGNDVLCAAIDAYINGQIYIHTQEAARIAFVAGTTSSLIAGLAAATALITGGTSILIGAAINTGIFLAMETWNAILNDAEAQRKVKCCMFDDLVDMPLTKENFQNSVLDCGFTGGNESILAQQIYHDNHYYDENWRAFLRALNQATGGNAEDCNCDCGDDLILEDYGGHGTVIMPMGNCVYKITQTIEDGNSGCWIAGFKDSLDRCLSVQAADGYPMQSVTNSKIWDCDGVVIYDGVGGFAPIPELGRVEFRLCDGFINTFYKITLAV